MKYHLGAIWATTHLFICASGVAIILLDEKKRNLKCVLVDWFPPDSLTPQKWTLIAS